jgi:hypothetical protein
MVLMESSMEFPKNLKIELPYNPVIPLLGGRKSEVQKDNPHVHFSIIHNSQGMEKSLNVHCRQMKTENRIHYYIFLYTTEYYSWLLKKGNHAILENMDEAERHYGK